MPASFDDERSPLSQLATWSLAVGGVSREAVAGNDELMDALKDVWDGTPAHARALATVIRSLGLFKSPPLQNRSTS